MRTTYEQQAEAIKKAMKACENKFAPSWGKKRMSKFTALDKQWIALNDAYSSITALRLKFVKPLNKMDKNQQYEHALTLIEFCERDLTTENVALYFRLHASDLTKEQRNTILLTALSLL